MVMKQETFFLPAAQTARCPGSKSPYAPLRIKKPLRQWSGFKVYPQILLLFDHSFAQVGTFRLRGCRGFAGPMYLHHSE